MPEEALSEDRVKQLLEFYALRHFSAEAARNLVRSSITSKRSFLTLGRVTEAEELEAWTQFQVGLELIRRLGNDSSGPSDAAAPPVQAKATAKAPPPVLPAWSEALGDSRQLSRRGKPDAQSKEDSSNPVVAKSTPPVRAKPAWSEQLARPSEQHRGAAQPKDTSRASAKAPQESSDPLFGSDPWSTTAPRGPPPCRLGPPPVPAKASSDPLAESDPWSSNGKSKASSSKPTPVAKASQVAAPARRMLDTASSDPLAESDPWSSNAKSKASSSKPAAVAKASQVAAPARRMLDTAMRNTQRIAVASASASKASASTGSTTETTSTPKASASSTASDTETMPKLKAFLTEGDLERKAALLRKCADKGQKIEGIELEAEMVELAIEEVRKAQTPKEVAEDGSAWSSGAWSSGWSKSTNEWSSGWSWNARDDGKWDSNHAAQETAGAEPERDTEGHKWDSTTSGAIEPIATTTTSANGNEDVEEDTVAKLVQFLSTHQDPEKAKMIMRNPNSGVSLSAVGIAIQRFEANCRAQAFGPYQ